MSTCIFYFSQIRDEIQKHKEPNKGMILMQNVTRMPQSTSTVTSVLTVFKNVSSRLYNESKKHWQDLSRKTATFKHKANLQCNRNSKKSVAPYF